MLDEAAMDEMLRKDALVAALLPDVPFDGWTHGALRAAARRIGMEDGELAALFPRGPRDAVAWFSRWADRMMLEGRWRRGRRASCACTSASPRPSRSGWHSWRPIARRCGAACRSWRCRPTGRWRRGFSTRRWMRRGTRPATARPIFLSIRSARSSPASTRRRRSIGSTTAPRGGTATEAFLDRRIFAGAAGRSAAPAARRWSGCLAACPTRCVFFAGGAAEDVNS